MRELDQVIRAAQQGDQAAFGALYEEFFSRVYRYVAARVGPGADAEDVTQEVFVRAMRSLGTFQHRGRPFAAWLFRIAHNLVVDRYRRAGVSGPSVDLESVTQLRADTDVEGAALRALDVERLRAAMERITDLQRQVILLRFIAGLSLAETAEAMNRKENAVKALQHSALQALRRVLQPSIAEAEAGI